MKLLVTPTKCPALYALHGSCAANRNGVCRMRRARLFQRQLPTVRTLTDNACGLRGEHTADVLRLCPRSHRAGVMGEVAG
jgi:hypothetical protein